MSFVLINRRITFYFALAIIVTCLCYSIFIIGSLMHELVHAEYATSPPAIFVNYDLSGGTNSDSFVDHRHDLVYLKGGAIEAFLIIVVMFCLVVVMCQ